MKIPNVQHIEVDPTHHVVSVEGHTRNIGGHGETKEAATEKFLENAAKVRSYMGDDEFAEEFSVTEMSDQMEQPQKQTGISTKTPAEDELLNGKPKPALEPLISEKTTGDKPAGNLTGEKGQTPNDLTGAKP